MSSGRGHFPTQVDDASGKFASGNVNSHIKAYTFVKYMNFK